MPRENLVGQTIAGYALESEVGEGGTAAVFRARHATHGTVAVKGLRELLTVGVVEHAVHARYLTTARWLRREFWTWSDERRAAYEKVYKAQDQKPWPKIVAVHADVDIEPRERVVHYGARYTLENKTSQPMEEVAVAGLQFGPRH